jgi:hypothetical protein
MAWRDISCPAQQIVKKDFSLSFVFDLEAAINPSRGYLRLSPTFDYRRSWMPWLTFHLLNNRLSVSWPVVTWRSCKLRHHHFGTKQLWQDGLNEANQEGLLLLLRETVTVCTQRSTVFPQTPWKCFWVYLTVYWQQGSLSKQSVFTAHHWETPLWRPAALVRSVRNLCNFVQKSQKFRIFFALNLLFLVFFTVSPCISVLQLFHLHQLMHCFKLIKIT